MSRKLHIGGIEGHEGWEILNAIPAPCVTHLADARDLSQFPENTFSEIYASHVVEHFDYKDELTSALKEWCRVLIPGGIVYISVPDLDTLSRLFLSREKLTFDDRFMVMRMMFGGHVDEYDYHQTGLDQHILANFLALAGFVHTRRVKTFKLFNDTSCMLFHGIPVSLNLIAEKPS